MLELLGAICVVVLIAAMIVMFFGGIARRHWYFCQVCGRFYSDWGEIRDSLPDGEYVSPSDSGTCFSCQRKRLLRRDFKIPTGRRK